MCDADSIFKAEQYYRSNENLEQAVQLYKCAFKNRTNDVSKIIDAISCAAKIKDEPSIISFIEHGNLAGLSPNDIERLWVRIGNGLNYSEIISKCDTVTNRDRYLKSLNSHLIDSLRLIAFRDQEYRGQEEDDLWSFQLRNDSLNWIDLRKMTAELNRLPKYSEIGFEGAEDLDILFYHMPKEELEWFLPYIMKNITVGESNLGEVILYQLDRIGMSEELIYSVSDKYEIIEIGKRTKLKNGYFCQAFGEWFNEKSPRDKKLYAVPVDPNISIKEVNRVRQLFGQDIIESKWKRQPWVHVVNIEIFEEKIN